ncbi:MAG: nucleotide sugar dehydrogenase, partial [Planctomycetes bacterium]|nr:nucleotide sugar dehydrogenase [Planctomycetota bacterium]
AEKLGYIPQVILAGRRINDGMGKFIAQRTVKEMVLAGHKILNSTVTVLGLTFKENCPDLRNSKVIDIIRELQDYGVNVQVHDPIADHAEAEREYGIHLITSMEKLKPADAVIAAVAHQQYLGMSVDRLTRLMNKKPVLIDVKCIFDTKAFERVGVRVWVL